MKKQLLLAGGAVAATLVMTGCAGVGHNLGGPSPLVGAPNFYSKVSANSMIQPNAPARYTIVKRNVKGTAKMNSYFGCVSLGDTSFNTLKAAALRNAPGANDLIDIKIDYDMTNICGICETVVTITGTAVKY